jgi:hypothetical protein
MNLYLTSSIEVNQCYDEYKPQFNLFNLLDSNLIEINNCEFFNPAGLARLEDNSTIPFARIIDPNKENVSDLTGTCAIRLDIAPKQDNVIIDGIIIEVNSFNPIPLNMSIESILKYIQPRELFYAEIDDPTKCHKNCFEANLAKDGKIIYDGFKSGTVYFTKDYPEHAIVRINAKTPGIYSFSCMILARYEKSKDYRIITGYNDKPFEFVFIK